MGKVTPAPERKPVGFVIKVPGRGYIVRSRTHDGWWLVTHDGCDCPATTRRCWHVVQAEAYERALTTPRPVAPPHISAMVD